MVFLLPSWAEFNKGCKCYLSTPFFKHTPLRVVTGKPPRSWRSQRVMLHSVKRSLSTQFFSYLVFFFIYSCDVTQRTCFFWSSVGWKSKACNQFPKPLPPLLGRAVYFCLDDSVQTSVGVHRERNTGTLEPRALFALEICQGELGVLFKANRKSTGPG